MMQMLDGYIIVHDDHIEVIKYGEEPVKLARKKFDEFAEFEGIPHRIMHYDVQKNEPVYGFFAGEFLFVRSPGAGKYDVFYNGRKLFSIPRKNVHEIKNFLETIRKPCISLDGAPHQVYYIMGEFVVFTILGSRVVVASLPVDEPKTEYSAGDVQVIGSVYRLPEWLKTRKVLFSKENMIKAIDEHYIPFKVRMSDRVSLDYCGNEDLTSREPNSWSAGPAVLLDYCGNENPKERPKYCKRLYPYHLPTNYRVTVEKLFGKNRWKKVYFDYYGWVDKKVKAIDAPNGIVILYKRPKRKLTDWELRKISDIINGRNYTNFEIAVVHEDGVVLYDHFVKNILIDEGRIFLGSELSTWFGRTVVYEDVGWNRIVYDGRRLSIGRNVAIPIETAEKLYTGRPLKAGDILPGFPETGRFEIEMINKERGVLRFSVDGKKYALPVVFDEEDYFRVYYPGPSKIYMVPLKMLEKRWGKVVRFPEKYEILDLEKFGITNATKFDSITIRNDLSRISYVYCRDVVTIEDGEVYVNGEKIENVNGYLYEISNGDLDLFMSALKL